MSAFLSHLDFSQVSLCDRAVSMSEWVSRSVREHFSHYHLYQTHNFDETWPQASYLMPNKGLLTASKSALIKRVYGVFFDPLPQNRYLLSSLKLYTISQFLPQSLDQVCLPSGEPENNIFSSQV